MTETATPSVYSAIAAVMKALTKEGITKSRTNSQPGANYKFRGVDDVYNTLSAILAENDLCIIPRVLSRTCVERQSSKGNPLFYTTVDVEFDLVCALDGSKHTARTVGEAMDSGDKSSNKAMSAAYKYMAFQTFCIPTEGDNDADAQTHELAPYRQEPAKPKSAYRAKQEGLGPRADELIHSLRESIDEIELTQWGKDHADEIAGLPANWQKMIRDEFAEQRIRLRAAPLDEGFRGAVGPGERRAGGLANGAGHVEAA